MGSDREFDIVVWGATGFAGELVAEYLGRAAPDSIRWAIAGRDETKLKELAAKLGGERTTLTADAHDLPSLYALAERARVILTTVGPYARYGSGLVEACVARGTDYADLSGEVPWIQRMIDAHHDRARERGVRIVHCCGFDSIPSDLGTLALQRAAQDDGGPCDRVDFVLERVAGGVSGGTIASLLDVLEEAGRGRAARSALKNPYSLNPPEARSRATRQPPLLHPPAHLDGPDAWVAPFLMAPINARVVHRTNALLGDLYGPEFRYTESVRVGRGARGAIGAWGSAAGYSAAIGALSFGPAREAMRRWVLPKPGSGPDQEARERGHFRAALFGRRADGARYLAEVGAESDPGYGATALMLGEAGLCLASGPLDDDRVEPAGVLTPAAAMGEALIARLREAGMTLTARRA